MKSNPPANQFPLERHLAEILERDFPGKCATSGRIHTIIPRLSVGQIVPDLVIVVRAAGRGTARLRKLTLFECAVLCVVIECRHPPTATETADRLLSRQSVVDRAVAGLVRQRLVKLTKDGAIRPVSRKAFNDHKIIAVEAKLSRWKEAIDQARSYLAFADQSFVALPESLTKHNRHVRQACREAGVGLLAVSLDGVRIVSRRRGVRPVTPARLWVLSSVLSRPIS